MFDKLLRPWILSVMLLASVAACTSLPDNTSHFRSGSWSPSVMVSSQAEELMVYYDSLRKLPVPELVKEYDKARLSLTQSRTDVNRIRVAMLLAMPSMPFHDLAAASGLLNEVSKEIKAPSPGLRGLVSMMAMLISEQQRANNNADDLSQKLKDEQKRADTLQTQVDGIKNMEKNLIRRDRRGLNVKP
jgi:hypothetical protein